MSLSRHPTWALLVAPALALNSGLGYALGNSSRTATPTFDAAKAVMPIQAWGVVFLCSGVLCLGAFLAQSVDGMAIALWLQGTLHLWWGANFAVQALTHTEASLVAWGPWTMLAVFHWVVAHRIWIERHL